MLGTVFENHPPPPVTLLIHGMFFSLQITSNQPSDTKGFKSYFLSKTKNVQMNVLPYEENQFHIRCRTKKDTFPVSFLQYNVSFKELAQAVDNSSLFWVDFLLGIRYGNPLLLQRLAAVQFDLCWHVTKIFDQREKNSNFREKKSLHFLH